MKLKFVLFCVLAVSLFASCKSKKAIVKQPQKKVVVIKKVNKPIKTSTKVNSPIQIQQLNILKSIKIQLWNLCVNLKFLQVLP